MKRSDINQKVSMKHIFKAVCFSYFF